MQDNTQKNNVGNSLGVGVENAGLSIPAEKASPEEKKAELSKSLHHDTSLPHLRTFQGDVANFIKSKDQSLAHIVVKEQEKKEKKEIKSREVERVISPKAEKTNNAFIYVVGMVLLLGVGITAIYLLLLRQSQRPVNVRIEQNILASNKTVAVPGSSLNADEIGNALNTLRGESDFINGIVAIQISAEKKGLTLTSKDFVVGTRLHIPDPLLRTLGNDFMLGLYSVNIVSKNFFLILKIKDFPIAFRDMLVWEEEMVNDFQPMLKTTNFASSTPYVFKDLIVRNKDTRAALSPKGELRLIYTFLDKETILITESEEAIKALVDAYVAGNTVR